MSTINDDNKYGKIELGKSDIIKDPSSVTPKGFSWWIEYGVYYAAPTIDPNKFGGHAYDNDGYEQGIRDCPCGCYMGSSNSSGPVDPFGHCPLNPLPEQNLNL